MHLHHHPPSSSLANRAWPWPAWLSSPDGDGGDSEGELQNWSSLIGIITAICGNVLISLALNVQRYAHIRLHRKKLQIRERARQALKNAVSGAHSQGTDAGYGAAGTPNDYPDDHETGMRPGVGSNGRYSNDDARDSSETDPLAQSFRSDDSRWAEQSGEEEIKVASTYLKDPYWWLGQVLITVGEMGNFLAYGFAPASIVSPLGVVALVSNCVIAPIFFKEVFRQRDFWGVIIAITGAVTVVLSAKTEETKLGPHEVWDAITTMEFEIYMGVSVALIALLMWLSPRYGRRTILIDLGLVGLFGGYTVLSTKGVSSMLSSTLFGAFTTPVTYGLVFVLLFTAIMQVRYLNKALQRFESTQVIPTQFVIFTLSVIIGSAVLYRDFERTTSEQAVKFVGGCLLTFFGVFLITSGRPRQGDEEEATLSHVDGIEETIGLAPQDPAAASPTPRQLSRQSTDTLRSQRSSRASRLSFKEAINRPLAALSKAGFTTSRVTPGASSNQKPLFVSDEDGDEDDEHSPLLGNPWRESGISRDPPRPLLGPHTISSDSVISVVASTAVTSDGESQGASGFATPHHHNQPRSTAAAAATIPTLTGTTPPRITTNTNSTTTPGGGGSGGAPSTPRASLQPNHYSGPVISPSPFSSTLTAVVGDKLLAQFDGPAAGHSPTPGTISPGGAAAAASTRRRNSQRTGRSHLSLFGSPLVAHEQQQQIEEEGGEAERSIRQNVSRLRAGEGSLSAVDRTTGHFPDGVNGASRGDGLRGRARSLSHTLGLAGLFGSSRRGAAATTAAGTGRMEGGDGTSDARDEEQHAGPFGGVLLARARTAAAAGSGAGVNPSMETL